MFWEYSRKDTKILLIATLLVFASFSLVISQSWRNSFVLQETLPASTIGVFAGVEENEVNKLVAQLDRREQELTAREQMLIQMESTVDDKRTLLIVSMVGMGLFGLILLNFYLDSKRRISLA